MKRSFLFLATLGAFSALTITAMADVEIRQVVPVSPGQRLSIQKMPATAPALALLRRDADALLDAKPLPIREIFYQGQLDNHPKRIETQKSLADMDKLAALSEAYAATGDARYAAKAREFVLAWVKAYGPNGNSINENKLEPVFVAYDLLRDTFSTEEKESVETWIRKIARQQIDTNGWRDREHSKKALDNWDSKRIKLVGVAGWVLGEQEWIDYGIQGFKGYVALGLFPDGTSSDLKSRDALSYHVSGLRPLLVMAMWADLKIPGEGRKLFDYVAPNGASLRKSVEYVVPFATGEKIREEWKNTTVGLDRERAAAGLAYYQPGKHFDPLTSLEMFEMASLFDPKFVPVVQDVNAKKGAPGGWLSVLALNASAT